MLVLVVFMLIVVGVLVVSDWLLLLGLVLVVLVVCLFSDMVWYFVGWCFGVGVMCMLCCILLLFDFCVK